MSPEEAAFDAACRANPADDLPRLVYADWLDEHGEGALAARVRPPEPGRSLVSFAATTGLTVREADHAARTIVAAYDRACREAGAAFSAVVPVLVDGVRGVATVIGEAARRFAPVVAAAVAADPPLEVVDVCPPAAPDGPPRCSRRNRMPPPARRRFPPPR